MLFFTHMYSLYRGKGYLEKEKNNKICTDYCFRRSLWGILYQIQKSTKDKKAERLEEEIISIKDEQAKKLAEMEKNIKLLDSSPASRSFQNFSRWKSGALSSFGIEDEKSTGGFALHTTDDAEETMHRGRLGSLGVDMENRGGIYDSLVQFDPAS